MGSHGSFQRIGPHENFLLCFALEREGLREAPAPFFSSVFGEPLNALGSQVGQQSATKGEG